MAIILDLSLSLRLVVNIKPFLNFFHEGPLGFGASDMGYSQNFRAFWVINYITAPNI